MAEAAPSSELTVGSIVAGTYKLTGLLGKGGMGAVWAADHERLPGKRVAIKVLHAEVAEDNESLVRFRREAEIASRLGHQNIVDVFDFNTLPDGAPYLVLEYLEGEALSTRLLRGPMPFDEVCQFVRQIGSALDAAHAEGIIHRDLKPQNVFLCPRQSTGFAVEEAKILDFGISKIRGSNTVKTQDHTMLGTPQYMAPEQATGNHDAVDGRTDVFAFAAMVYEMLSGQPAFGGQTIPEVVFKVVYESPRELRELVPTITPAASAAIHKALEKKSEDRFVDVSAFVLALTGSPITTLRRAAVMTSGQANAEAVAATATPSSLKASDLGMGTAPTQTGNPMAALAQGGVAGTGAGVRPAAITPAPVNSGSPPAAAQTGKEAFAQTVGSASQPVPDIVVASESPAAKPGKRGLVLTVAGLLISGALITFLVVRGGSGSDDKSAANDPQTAVDKQDDVNSQDPGSANTPPTPDKPDTTDTKGDTKATPNGDTKVGDPTVDVKAGDPKTTPGNDTKVAKKAVTKVTPTKVKTPTKRRTVKTNGGTKTKAPPRKKLDPRVAKLLSQANAALNAGNMSRARYLAQRAMAAGGKLSAAYAVIAKTYCKEQNLGMARANLRNVRGGLRSRVMAYCKRQGVFD